jgi:hypothetical protein
MSFHSVQEWFTGSLESDQLVLRVHVAVSGLGNWTTILAFCGWYDDMAPNGSVFTYKHGENDRDGLAPLDPESLDQNANRWGADFQRLCRLHGLKAWQNQKATVCTIGQPRQAVRLVPASHPLVQPHLAAMWALSTVVPEDVGPFWAQSYGIVTRRLGGLVKANMHALSRQIEVL